MAGCSTPTDRAIPPGARQDQHHRAPTSAGRSAPPDAARAPRPNYWPRSAELSAPPTPKRRHDQGSRREQHRRDPHPWVAQLHGRSPGSLHIRRDRTGPVDGCRHPSGAAAGGHGNTPTGRTAPGCSAPPDAAPGPTTSPRPNGSPRPNRTVGNRAAPPPEGTAGATPPRPSRLPRPSRTFPQPPPSEQRPHQGSRQEQHRRNPHP